MITEVKFGLVFHFYVVTQFYIHSRVGVNFNWSLPPLSCSYLLLKKKSGEEFA